MSKPATKQQFRDFLHSIYFGKILFEDYLDLKALHLRFFVVRVA